MSKARVGFVIEQALGHVAYGMNLRAALAARDDIEIVWLEVPYLPEKLGPLPLHNWTLRGSARAWSLIRRAHNKAPLDALFLHTQTISLFAGGFMGRIPTLLSLDATPKNLDQLAGSYAHSVGNPIAESIKGTLHRRVIRKARWYTTWSDWAKRSLVDDYDADGSKVTVVHPGTTLANFPAPETKQRDPARPLQILFVGGDLERKGGDLLLSVFTESLRGACELHLVTAADVEPRQGVHVYHDVKPHSQQLLKLYRDADVFVLPTRGDCLAVVLGEAMASSMPIVTTAVGAHTEAVEDGESGYIIGVDDAGALRDRLLQMASDRGLVARMGARSRAIGEARFDMAKGASQIGDILVRIAGAKDRPTLQARREGMMKGEL
jgi:glycosyltransferase involved in cell wall biosynthesis